MLDLDSKEFKLLIKRLDPDETEAAKKYQNLRERLVRQCFRADEFLAAEELADKALDVLARKLASEDIVKLDSYAFKVLDYLLLAKRRLSRPMTMLSENMPANDNPEYKAIHKLDGEKKVECFLQCVSRLDPAERWLLFAYYPAEDCNVEDRRRQITTRLGIETGTLRTRMNRLRTKIEKCCMDCYRRASRGQPRGPGMVSGR